MTTPFSIGLTGGIGSGKSTIAQCFQSLGVTLVDTDQIARDVVAPGQPVLQQIAEKFGSEALLASGELNRPFVRKCTFADPELKNWLNGQLHPLIRSTMQAQMQAAQSAYCIVDVPLLTENKMAPLFNRVLVVDCPETLQIERAMARDASDEAGIRNIIAAQASRAQRREIADDIILNDRDLEHVQQEVSTLHQRYIGLSKAHQ